VIVLFGLKFSFSFYIMLEGIYINCVVAVGKKLGIGIDNKLPWHIPEDMKYFKELTTNHIVIMGNNTFKSMKNVPLTNRINIVFSSEQKESDNEQHLNFVNDFSQCHSLLRKYNSEDPTKKVFVIGGECIYKMFESFVDTIYLTEVYHNSVIDFNSFFYNITSNYVLKTVSPLRINTKGNIEFRHLVYELNEDPDFLKDTHDHKYLTLCKKVLDEGQERIDRTKTGTVSIFGEQMKFDIRTSIPILTTKRVSWKSCIEELLWFMRGDTDAKVLQEKNIKIWDGNSTKDFLTNVGLGHLEEGDCGANYSFQWRHFGAKYDNCHSTYTGSNSGVDQIKYIEDLLKTNKTSRRIFMSAWNPCDLKNTVLPPCHVSAQFYVDSKDQLSCHLYQRSCDMFLGVPFNILSYSVLTHILAKRNNLKTGYLTISTGDTHIYKDHIEQIKTQISREPYSYPILEINDSVITKSIESISINDFHLIGYFPHNTIRGKMSV